MKKCGMRDSREKGGGMRDQDPPPSRPCLNSYGAVIGAVPWNADLTL